MMRVPAIVKAYYPDLIWRIPTSQKEIYLTFDDGPTPFVTKWVLDQLRLYNAKATFFCLGKNVKEHPVIYKNILKEGHAVGNHTFDHKNGWKSNNFEYIRNVLKGSVWIRSDLFRPPYGRIKKAQIKKLKDRFRIVMWDVLSEDYNSSISSEKCFHTVRNQSRNGSIVVFHDSRKAQKNLKKILPEVLAYFSERGYLFKAIT